MVFWVGEWCVCVWQDVFVEENLFVNFFELFNANFDGAGILLFQHTPEFFRFIFQDVWELEL